MFIFVGFFVKFQRIIDILSFEKTKLLFFGENPDNIFVSKNNTDSINCFEILRENFNDEIYCNNNTDNIDKISDDIKFDFIFFETDNDKYFHSIIDSIILALKNQSHNGTIIIKISDIFHKPVVDALYFLTSLISSLFIFLIKLLNISRFLLYSNCCFLNFSIILI